MESKKQFKIIAWNIVSLTAALKYPEYKEYLRTCDADIFCLSETKLNNNENLESYFYFLKNSSEYYYYSNHCTRRGGYSGVLLASKQKLENDDVFMNLIT
jgi:exonuclease III